MLGSKIFNNKYKLNKYEIWVLVGMYIGFTLWTREYESKFVLRSDHRTKFIKKDVVYHLYQLKLISAGKNMAFFYLTQNGTKVAEDRILATGITLKKVRNIFV